MQTKEGDQGSTCTVDGAGKAEFFKSVPTDSALPMAVRIHLRHARHNLWCGTGGTWFHDRSCAIPFRSNLDVLLYCQILHLRGFIVGFGVEGQQVYQLDASRIIEALCRETDDDVAPAEACAGTGTLAASLPMAATAAEKLSDLKLQA